MGAEQLNDFFDDERVLDIAKDHIYQLLGFEDDTSTKILKKYKEVRRDLQDRLNVLPRGTFSAQQMSGTLVQIDSAISAMEGTLSSEMSSSGLDIAEMGVNHLLSEISSWNEHFLGAVVPINLNALAVATDTNNFLFNRRAASLTSYSSQLRSQFANSITEGIAQQMTSGQIVQGINQTFMGEEWKLQRLVRTELHNVYSQGKLQGMSDLVDDEIPDLMKTLFHTLDNRTGKDTKILIAHNLVVPVDEPFVDYSTGKKLEYMAPPNRPNDRAILIPYRESWK